MDNSTPVLSVAEAVAAATNAQNQQNSHPSPPTQTQGSSGVDNLTCQWQGCGERCDTAESLYDHVCERHVGRKSTNNLNLTCQWGACRTTTVKRDHITSHIRVHVPLKPHKCDFCGKAFKRPQDLKKHVKTHADDSVLMNSPSQGNSRSNMGGSGGMGQNGKPYGYSPAQHDGGMGNPYPNYQPAMSNGANGYAQTAGNGQYAGYGSVSYPASNMQDVQSMDTRRRAIEALNDFLGDIKRRAIDPNTYYDVGHRLQSNALPLPVGNGYNTGYSQPVAGGYTNYNTTASILESFNQGSMGGNGGGAGGVSLASGYSLPLPNARTKNDLQDIDRFLEQLQATVYETSNHVAASGFQQPGMHAIHTGDFGYNNHQGQYRSSHSPTSYSSNSSVGAMGAMSSATGLPNVTSTALETPALTPAASVTSYASSGQSPLSSHGRASLGSLGGYPNLPSVTPMSDLGAGYPTTTSAPASSLASGFEGLDGRRYSGGHLRRQAPTKTEDTEMADYEDGARTPKASEGHAKAKGASSIDPALRGEEEKSPSESASTPAASASEGAEDKRQEEWVENIRVIEALRKWVADRIKNGEFESERAAATAAAAPAEDAKEGADSKSVEIAKMVEEKMADADEEQRVDYPTLPSSS